MENLKKKIEGAKKIVKDVESEYREAAFTAVLTRLLMESVEEKIKKKPKVERVGLPAKIIEVRNKGFFKESKTVEETRQALKNMGIPYTIDRVGMALLRLARKRELRRFKEERNGKVLVYAYP